MNSIKVFEKDFVAFSYRLPGEEEERVIVAQVGLVTGDGLFVVFATGGKDITEVVQKQDLIAIFDTAGTHSLRGYQGKFIPLHIDHPALIKQ